MKSWSTRIAIVWSIFWMAFGLGCIERAQGNSMVYVVVVHTVIVVMHIPPLIANIYLSYKFRQEFPSESD